MRAQQLKTLGTKPDSLSSISHNDVVQRELTTQLSPALHPYATVPVCVHIHTPQHEWFE